jgi:ppGpp synthetase/RelA/SpoT-type nucleotidyltranferase
MKLTDKFLARYTREKDHYANAATLCAEQCEAMLNQTGIRAIVSHRPKREDRLAEKLQNRQKRKGYKTLEDIYEDLADLAGVRIALYFPDDKRAVEQLINAMFVVERKKAFPRKRGGKFESSYGVRFSGYGALHYHVRLKKKEYEAARIEIQVASVLMHAWAEVEHDLLYKRLTGTGDPSLSERALLDQINGLVLAGEIALEQLQNAINSRISLEERQFNNHYELAAYLYEKLTTQH